MTPADVYDSIYFTLQDLHTVEVKDETLGNSAVFFTVLIDGEEFDISIKDASLRESK